MDELIRKLTEFEISDSKPVLLCSNNWFYDIQKYSMVIIGDFKDPLSISVNGILRAYSRHGKSQQSFVFWEKGDKLATRILLAPIGTTDEELDNLVQLMPTALIVVTTVKAITFVPNHVNVFKV